jgi:hypothetical protein
LCLARAQGGKTVSCKDFAAWIAAPFPAGIGSTVEELRHLLSACPNGKEALAAVDQLVKSKATKAAQPARVSVVAAFEAVERGAAASVQKRRAPRS